jgi:hypothetical protein
MFVPTYMSQIYTDNAHMLYWKDKLLYKTYGVEGDHIYELHYGYTKYYMDIWNTIWIYEILYGYMKYYTDIWSTIWIYEILYGYMKYYMDIWSTIWIYMTSHFKEADYTWPWYPESSLTSIKSDMLVSTTSIATLNVADVEFHFWIKNIIFSLFYFQNQKPKELNNF